MKYLHSTLCALFLFSIVAYGADAVELIKKHVGDEYQISIKNNDAQPYVVKVDVELSNMQTDVPLPYIATIPALSEHFVFTITRVDTSNPGRYAIDYTWRKAELESRNCAEDKFCIVTKTVGDSIYFFLENKQFVPITVTFIPEKFENVATAQLMPFTRSYAGNRTTKMFTAWMTDPWGARNTGYHYKWQYGIVVENYDRDYAYALPYSRGKAFVMGQGPNGEKSHQGKYAYDFNMPEGSAVCAARSGIVIDVVDNFTDGGASEQYRNHGNAIEIMHDDGTIGRYSHLATNGALVNLGDKVGRGQKIALSGNTGYSSGPHLHFDVVRLTSELDFETIPIQFQVTKQRVSDLKEGDRFEAFE